MVEEENKQPECPVCPPEQKKDRWKDTLFIVGLTLIGLSFIKWIIVLLVLPFLDMEFTKKAAVGTVLMILGEIMFWVGAILTGPEIIAKYKHYFKPSHWFKRKKVKR